MNIQIRYKCLFVFFALFTTLLADEEVQKIDAQLEKSKCIDQTVAQLEAAWLASYEMSLNKDKPKTYSEKEIIAMLKRCDPRLLGQEGQ
jgi:hypothetical protein